MATADQKSTYDEPEDGADQQCEPERCSRLRHEEADHGLAPVLKDEHHRQDEDHQADDPAWREAEPTALAWRVRGHRNVPATTAPAAFGPSVPRAPIDTTSPASPAPCVPPAEARQCLTSATRGRCHGGVTSSPLIAVRSRVRVRIRPWCGGSRRLLVLWLHRARRVPTPVPGPDGPGPSSRSADRRQEEP